MDHEYHGPPVEITGFSDNLTCGQTEECDLVRFVSTSVFSFIAVFGAASNLLLVFIFTTKKYSNAPVTLYPTVLAILDTLICVYYVLMFGIDVIGIYFEIEILFVIYHYYILPIFFLSKVTQLAIPYMLIFVTMERYAWISEKFKSFWLFTSKGRSLGVTICLLIIVLLRVPFAASLTVDEFPLCPDFFRTLAVGVRAWSLQSQLYVTYDFQIMAVIHIFVPFVALVFFNSLIVSRLSFIQRQTKKLDCSNSESLIILVQSAQKMATIRKNQISKSKRNAVVTTLAIVTSYLVCNSLHMFLTLLERTNSPLLWQGEAGKSIASSFYTIFADSINILYMLSSASRIVIYCKCNSVIWVYVSSIFSCLAPQSTTLRIREALIKRRMSMLDSA